MAKGMRVVSRVIVASLACVGFCKVWQSAFVPPVGQPLRLALPLVTAAAGMVAATPAAFADGIEDAARKMADASYPIFASYDWVKNPQLANFYSAASWSPTKIAAAADKVLDVALAMDPKLVSKSVAIHEKALAAAIPDPKLLAPLADVEDIFVSLARVIGSAGPEKNEALFAAVKEMGGANLASDFYSAVNPADAAATYKAFEELIQAQRR